MSNLLNGTRWLSLMGIVGAIASLTGCGAPTPDSQDLVLKLMQQRECSGCDLGAVNLPDSNLAGVNLSGANLAGANLQGANLKGSNLEGADLSGANLSGADVTGVDLSKANTEGATLP